MLLPGFLTFLTTAFTPHLQRPVSFNPPFAPPDDLGAFTTALNPALKSVAYFPYRRPHTNLFVEKLSFISRHVPSFTSLIARCAVLSASSSALCWRPCQVSPAAAMHLGRERLLTPYLCSKDGGLHTIAVVNFHYKRCE